ncbi:MAG: hypothetical protein WCA95_14385 [Opitutaceae bacterium]|jgi:hypothetical protein
MSHIHNIGGFQDSVAEFRARLEQMRAARDAKRGGSARTFDSAVLAYEDGEQHQEPEREQEDQTPEEHADPDEDFGVWYV